MLRSVCPGHFYTDVGMNNVSAELLTSLHESGHAHGGKHIEALRCLCAIGPQSNGYASFDHVSNTCNA